MAHNPCRFWLFHREESCDGLRTNLMERRVQQLIKMHRAWRLPAVNLSTLWSVKESGTCVTKREFADQR